jgi:hypothetical protein
MKTTIATLLFVGTVVAGPNFGQVVFPSPPFTLAGVPTATIAGLSPNLFGGTGFYIYGNDLDTLTNYPAYVASATPAVHLHDPIRGPLSMPFRILGPNLMVVWIPQSLVYLEAHGRISIGQLRTSHFSFLGSQPYLHIVDMSAQEIYL